MSSQQDAHVRAARNSDRSPRSHVASRKGARSASGMQSCWLDKTLPDPLHSKRIDLKSWEGARGVQGEGGQKRANFCGRLLWNWMAPNCM